MCDQHEVTDLVNLDAYLLDSWRLDEWLQLFTPDCRYIVPSLDLPDGRPDRDVVLIDDDRGRLEARIERLKSRFAHREYPSSRTRHLVQVVHTDVTDDGHVAVDAHFVVYRFRSGRVAEYVGRYEYLLVRTTDGLRIRSRKAVLDNEALDQHGAVSVIV